MTNLKIANLEIKVSGECFMNDVEWKQLTEMRDHIKQHGVQAFDTAYLEEYSRLLALSLEGKGDIVNSK